jgi:CRISPR-associated protein Cas1
MNDESLHWPLTRVMALHALEYCERLFYLEEVEEIRVADDRVFAGRRLHEEIADQIEDAAEWRTLELSSERLGLVGKVDCFRRREGGWVPYEHKRGRSRREGKESAAWPSDALQVSAYGLLLEEALGERIEEGRLRYHADGVTVRVPLDDRAREAVASALHRAGELRARTERPPVTTHDGRCVRCSLAPVCLPEEERLAQRPDWEPVRMFPPDRERLVVHVAGPLARVSRKGDTLSIEQPEMQSQELAVQEIESLVIHGYSQVSTQALHLCAANDISIHWFTAGGRHCGVLTGGGPQVHRRLRQYRALADPQTCLGLARRLVIARITGQLGFLLRATRGAQRSATLEEALRALRDALRSAARTDNPDSLRGYEGSAGAAYFRSVPLLLGADVPDELRHVGRTRRPPSDRFSAMLNFGYALLYGRVLQSVLAVGLEPALGFFHQPRTGAAPLALDLMELFRVPIWDMTVIGSLNRRQWDPKTDFDAAADHVWLSSEGRRKAIALFEERLDETWRHPVVQYSLSYARLIELEVRLLEKEWTGSPGLFARFRLR